MMASLLPAIVLPCHDPQGLYLPHLETITPQLKQLFSRAFISISPTTLQTQPTPIKTLEADDFFCLNFNEPGTLVGDHYRAAYTNAVTRCPPRQVLHLCDIDKVAFILQNRYKERFIADIGSIGGAKTPLLFQRSETAWLTYPQNYREIEQLAIKLAEFMFGRYLDIAWSHLVIRTDQLQQILPHLRSRDFGLLAEIVLKLATQLTTQEVDWLAWEDPFIYARDADELRRERSESAMETKKRLVGIKPISQILLATWEP